MDTHHREDTHLNKGDIHLRLVATHQQLEATLLLLEATPHRLADIHPKQAVTLLQRGATLKEATPPRAVVIPPQVEASLLRQEDTHSLEQEDTHRLEQEDTRSLEQEDIPPQCPQQVEAGVQHQAAMARLQVSRGTQEAPPQASNPCRITLEHLQLTLPCLHMEVEFHPTLRHLPLIEDTGVPLRTFQGLIL